MGDGTGKFGTFGGVGGGVARAAPARGEQSAVRAVGPWAPTLKQVNGLGLLEDRTKTRILFDGGGRSGKTACIAHWLLSRAARYPGSWQVVLRKARSHTVQSLWNGTFFEYLSKHWPDQRYWVLKRDELTIHFYNNSRILFDGCDDEARVRKLYGNEYLTIWFNEASEFPWEVVDQLMSRLVQRVVDVNGDEGQCKAVFDTNPRGPRHWVYKVGVQGVHPITSEPLRRRAWWGRLGGWTVTDNSQHLAQDALATYEDQDDITKRRMLHGEWCAEEGCVYDDFVYEEHVVPFDKYMDLEGRFKGKQIFRSIDFGYRDPFVCLVGGVDFDGRLVIFDEVYKRERIVSEHAAIIKERAVLNPVWWTVCDHDAEDTATLRHEGIQTRRAYKDRPIRDGLSRVKKRLKEGRLLFVAPDKNGKGGCPGLLSEIESYVWDREGDKPIGKDDHAMDALRYMVAELDRRVGSKLIIGA